MRSSSRPVGFTPPHAATSAPACRTGPTQTARRFSPGRQIRTSPIPTILSVPQQTERSREMNKTYRNIWNAATNTWMAVAETAKSRSKGSARAARQAVVALTLGGVAVGGAFAADACTTEDGASGSLDAAGVCRVSGAMSLSSIGTMAALDDTYIKVNNGGRGAATVAVGAIAMGGGATANTVNSVALGYDTRALGDRAVALGSTTFVDANATYGVAIGRLARVEATATNSVALGAGSNADRSDSVSVGSATQQRQITNMAAGTQATDAVNVSQLTPVVTALGGGAAINPTTGVVTGPTYNLTNGGTQTTVGGALGALDGELTTAKGDIAQNTTAITNINNQLGDIASGKTGIVQQDATTRTITVAKDTDGAVVDFTGTAGERKLAGVAAGEVSATSHEAINGSQLHGVSESVASAIGAGSTVNPDGSITAPTFTVGDGNGGTTVIHNVGDAVTNLDGRVTNNEGNIANLADQIGNGTVGLVQQDATTRTVTVAKDTDGAVVDFTGTAGERKLAGVAAGEVSATSNEAVNGSQLHGVSESVASAIGAGSTVNPDGSITAPSFTVGDGNGGTTIVRNVGDAVSNLDGRVTTNEGDIANLADQIGSGTVGLVQQDSTTRDITVAKNTDGTVVDFTGTAGDRKLAGVAAGEVSATSNEAVNGSQLHG
ncbi:ESPR domain-containing protein [Burkholderia pyrrocinia]|uniref:ESPR domain-containing protein n=1 Tax=Burkholderia pyrrocinia TaxID=60550 RepID=UPI0032613905